jgi:pyrroline-5-carboxylate reductase
VRIIPNAPSIIHQGYNPVVFHPVISSEEKSLLLQMFKHWGATPEVDEKLLEAYAIIAAMGPTYFWFQWLELQRLAQEFGIKENAANEAIAGMLHGAVDTLFKSNLSSAEVLDLIPVCPLKENEEAVREIFSGKLDGLYRKLSEAAK